MAFATYALRRISSVAQRRRLRLIRDHHGNEARAREKTSLRYLTDRRIGSRPRRGRERDTPVRILLMGDHAAWKLRSSPAPEGSLSRYPRTTAGYPPELEKTTGSTVLDFTRLVFMAIRREIHWRLPLDHSASAAPETGAEANSPGWTPLSNLAVIGGGDVCGLS